MIKRLLLASLLTAVTTAAFAASHQADDITGVWQTKSGGYVQIYKEGDVYNGKIVGSSNGKARYDKQNPDKTKQGRRLLGVGLLNGLHYEGDGSYDGGHIYDPKNGKTYKAKATLTGPDTLEARGYIGISLLGKSQDWKRISSSAEHVHQDLLE